MQLDHTVTDNPDQRISDDIDRYTSLSLGLSIGLMNSVVTLFSFLFILWTLSGILSIPLGGGRSFDIPGYMVYAAILYAAVGTWLTHRIGNPLARLLYDQQRYEADFRFSMVRLRENAESVAFYGGESREREVFHNRFTRIVLNWWDIIRRRKKLTWFTTGYSQAAVVFPFIVAAPRYFSKEIQLGGLMQIASAFGQVQDLLSFIISSYVEIAEYRSVVERLGGFRAKVDEVAAAQLAPQPIAIERGGGGVAVQGLDLHLPNGQRLREDIALSAEPGAPLLITGPSGAGKSTLLRAVAGLWPFGSGQVRVGQGRALFLPQRPYLPLGTLQDAILYPEIDPKPSRAEIEAALQRGRPRLSGRRISTRRATGPRRLSGGETQRVGFARVLLMRPAIVFLDEATSALDEAAEATLYRMLREAEWGPTVVSVGHRGTLRRFHEAVIDLGQPPVGAAGRGGGNDGRTRPGSQITAALPSIQRATCSTASCSMPK